MLRAPQALFGACLWIIFPISPAKADNSDLVKRGRDFSELACSFCHVVSTEDGRRPTLRQPAPSFAAIAARPSTTEENLRTSLTTKHVDMGPAERMPNPRLVDCQIDEVVAYILSLQRRP